MEECALCGKRARMVCESDQAKLCWECDHTVHGANFLVAKHTRILLCRLCQRTTSWKASGPTLPPTSTLCHLCLPNHRNHHRHEDHTSGDDDPEDEDDEEEEEQEEERENQVVPWSSASASTNSEADGDISGAAAAAPLPLKRFPDNSYIRHSEDEIACSSSGASTHDESSSMSVFRPLKRPRINHGEREAVHGTARSEMVKNEHICAAPPSPEPLVKLHQPQLISRH